MFTAPSGNILHQLTGATVAGVAIPEGQLPPQLSDKATPSSISQQLGTSYLTYIVLLSNVSIYPHISMHCIDGLLSSIFKDHIEELVFKNSLLIGNN
jgi:hypothetical protein